MYSLAENVDPESMYQIARFAYAELAMAGVCAVGEFHYVHHQPDGSPYDERTALADAVIEAARDIGIRISLLRVIYERAGQGKPLEQGQQRFCDASIDAGLQDIETLRSRYQDDPLVEVGVAIHSVRAVTRESMRHASAYAKDLALPLHMHLSEQRRELDECLQEHGMRPVQLAAEEGLLDEDFVAVHATHLDEGEIQSLGAARSFVCVCRTTERDLGDGHCDARGLLNAGARLCTGVDSHAISDPFEEARAIELDQRSRDEARTLVADASTLLAAASENGYAAIGFAGRSHDDQVTLLASDPALVGATPEHLDDAVIFAANPRAVDTVSIAGKPIVSDGRHSDYIAILRGYEAALKRLRSAAGL